MFCIFVISDFICKKNIQYCCNYKKFAAIGIDIIVQNTLSARSKKNKT